MSRIVVINHVTLDGVMQGPGRAEEDTRDGFAHGGWSVVDEEMQAAVFARVAEAGGLRLLLGRRSYEGMLGYWNTTDSPFRDGLNNAAKYVVSTTLREPLAWPNSTLLTGETAAAVTALKGATEGDLVIMGSGELIQTLMRAGLIDEYMLLIHPVVLGRGRRLFRDGGAAARLRLTSSRATPSGALVAVYQPVP